MDLMRLRDTVLRTEMLVGDEGETIPIHYRIGALGSTFTDWLITEGPSVHAALERACTCIGIEVDGAPVPCTAEALRAADIPLQVLHAILAHIREEARGGKLGAPSSRSGSLAITS